MRRDLDSLMQSGGLAGIVVFAADRFAPAMYYATGQKIHYGTYFRAADGRDHLIHDPMERDQAAAVGCDHSSFTQHGLMKLVESEGHPARAHGRLVGDMCASLGMRGPVAFFGELDASLAHAMLARLTEVNPDVTVDTRHPDVLTMARMIKDEREIDATRRAARGTVAAMERLREFLGALEADGDHFRSNGSGPVKLGDLRRLILSELLAHGLAEDGETIVSQGRDAGVPHNRGSDEALLKAGEPLIVDIFPAEAGGGYHSDLTRTFCVGHAPKPLADAYRDVMGAFELAMGKVKVGAACRSIQEEVCGFFAARGHATPLTNEGTQEGYVHGLGHGVGLAVHEAPRLGGPVSNTQLLEAGMVVTVEPGLYYPERGIGVRIEDLVVMTADGKYENLTPTSYDMEILPRG